MNFRRHLSAMAKQAESASDVISVGNSTFTRDKMTNIPTSILNKINTNLHQQTSHPIHQLSKRIHSRFPGFQLFNTLPPVVTVRQNFDDLLVDPSHVSRSTNDTYYVNKDYLLRTHTSAHQVELLRGGNNRFLVAADVYRRDEINATHYPVFHQMEGVCVFDTDCIHADSPLFNELVRLNGNKSDLWTTEDNQPQPCHDRAKVNLIALHLRQSLERMVRGIFPESKVDGPLQIRWVDSQFPFTAPSWEMEIFYRDKWLEVCGCGVVRQEILDGAGRRNQMGWAFGLGLERIAMVLHDIPDIRLFWSTDPRFISQFKQPELSGLSEQSPEHTEHAHIVKFQPFSKYPAVYKDISFWTSPTQSEFSENSFCELVREVCGDLVEAVELIDEFRHPKTGKQSKCYRILYRAMDRTLLNADIDRLQAELIDVAVKELGITIR